MNYQLSKEKASEMINGKLSHFFGVSPEEATYEQYYKAIAMIVRDMMSEGQREFTRKATKENTKRIYYLCMEFLIAVPLKTTSTT